MKKTVVSFGEIMLRLTPPDNLMITTTNSFDALYGGTESNVLVCLSAMGNATDYLTVLPENQVGDACIKHLRSYGVGTDNIIRRGDVLGMYFLENGFGDRGASVIYNRKNSEVSKATEKDFDYDEVFKNCGLFHISGISFALSQSARDLSFRLVKEAKARNILVSFDFNYRSKLWTTDEAREVYKEVIKYTDIVFCSGLDITVFLETEQDDFVAGNSDKYIIIREREILPDGDQRATVVMYHNGEIVASQRETSVLERIGSGDAFAGGILHGIINGYSLSETLDFGMTCFILKHTVKGDVISFSEDAVKNYINNMSKDVVR